MEPPSTATIHILNTSGKRVPVARLKAAIASALESSLTPTSRVEVLFADDAHIQDLNRTLRQKDEPTDVLTFPAPQFDGAPLGEIAISVPTAARQAESRGISLADELCYLAIHGALHLCGYDDIEDADRAVMFAKMHAVGLSFGLPEQTEWTSLPEAGRVKEMAR